MTSINGIKWKFNLNKLLLKEKVEIKQLARPLPELKLERKCERKAENMIFTGQFSIDIYKNDNWICSCEVINMLYCFSCVLFYNSPFGSSDLSWG